MPTMKALQYQRYGGPDQLREVEVPRPTPAPGQILVKVAASSVNPIDWKLHNGSFRFVKPVKMPSTPGFDIAGEIVQVGADVIQHHAGDLI
jgi:NADPH:quinone reductase-like Zn-dependent oxidoreductase